MHTLFYSNIYEFAGNLQGILDKEIYRTSIQNMKNNNWKAQYLKPDDVSMLGHGCGFS